MEVAYLKGKEKMHQMPGGVFSYITQGLSGGKGNSVLIDPLKAF